MPSHIRWVPILDAWRLDPGESCCARTQLRHVRPGVVGAAAHGARDGTGPQRFRVTPGEPCLQRMSALSRRNWSCGTQSPQRRVGGDRDTDSLFWLWAKANKQRLDLLLCLWAAAAAAEQTAYRGVNPARWIAPIGNRVGLLNFERPQLE